MSERMWLRATCAAIVLFAAPGLAAGAPGKMSRFSGPLKIQIGLDEFGEPAYADCGELELHKAGAGGREWRLNGTCDELIDLLVESPTPTPKPTNGTVTPTPTPRPSNNGECTDGTFSKISASHYSVLNVTLQVGRTHTFCVDLPAKSFPFFEIYTINKGNSSCSDLEMTAIPPSGRAWTDNGPAPGVRPNVEAGRWRVQLHLNEGCARYDFHVAY